MRRFFRKVADVIEKDSPHWMRHTHATHALARGAELTTVREPAARVDFDDFNLPARRRG